MDVFSNRPLHERFRDANGTPGEVFVTAHRGAFLSDGRIAIAENSVAAVERARAMAVDMVEIDVHRISDGTIVVIHDGTLDRTTDATGPVANLGASDLKEIALVHPKTRMGLGGSLPTLADIFTALGPQMMVNVELKSGLDMIPDVAAVAAGCGVSDQVTIKTNLRDGANFSQLKALADTCKDPVDIIPVIIDSRDGFEGLEEACRVLQPSCIECVVDFAPGEDGYNLLAKRGVTLDGGSLFSVAARRLCAEHNVRQFVNTLYVNPTKDGIHQWNGGRSCEMGLVAPDSVYGFWIAHGATMIQTDHPEYLLNWLRTAGFHS